MHLYPCVYLYFYTTVVMKQYLISFYAHLLQIYGYFEFLFLTYHLTSLVHSASLHCLLYTYTYIMISSNKDKYCSFYFHRVWKIGYSIFGQKIIRIVRKFMINMIDINFLFNFHLKKKY